MPVVVRLFAVGSDGCATFPDAGAIVDEERKTVSFWGYQDSRFNLGCTMDVNCVTRDVTFTPASAGT